jgi:hypothetical protein
MFFINTKRALPADMLLDKEEQMAAEERNLEQERELKALKKAKKTGKSEQSAAEEIKGNDNSEDGEVKL